MNKTRPRKTAVSVAQDGGLCRATPPSCDCNISVLRQQDNRLAITTWRSRAVNTAVLGESGKVSITDAVNTEIIVDSRASSMRCSGKLNLNSSLEILYGIKYTARIEWHKIDDKYSYIQEQRSINYLLTNQ
jgi:hypothetical protein